MRQPGTLRAKARAQGRVGRCLDGDLTEEDGKESQPSGLLDILLLSCSYLFLVVLVSLSVDLPDCCCGRCFCLCSCPSSSCFGRKVGFKGDI